MPNGSAAAGFVQRHLAAGVAALERGDVVEAEKEFLAALRLDPASADAHSDLAYVHATRREFDAAVRENREAVRLAPDRSDLMRNLGLALAWNGRTAEAVEVFRRVLELDPADAEARRMLEQLSRSK